MFGTPRLGPGLNHRYSMVQTSRQPRAWPRHRRNGGILFAVRVGSSIGIEIPDYYNWFGGLVPLPPVVIEANTRLVRAQCSAQTSTSRIQSLLRRPELRLPQRLTRASPPSSSRDRAIPTTTPQSGCSVLPQGLASGRLHLGILRTCRWRDGYRQPGSR